MNTEGRRGTRTWLNWVLALLTMPGAAFAMMFALGAAMGTDECSSPACANLGLSMTAYSVMSYSAPVVALVAIIVSFATAGRSWDLAVRCAPAHCWLSMSLPLPSPSGTETPFATTASWEPVPA